MAPGEGFGASSSPNSNVLSYKPWCLQCLRSPGFVGIAWFQGYLQPGMLGEGSPKAALCCIPAGACHRAVERLSSAGEDDLMCY